MVINKPRFVYPRSRTTYKKCQIASNELKEDNDCTVVSLAISGKIPYAAAHALMERQGRKSKQGAHPRQVSQALKDIGATEKRLDMEKLEKKNGGRGLTPNNIVKVLSKYRTYIAYTHNHVLTIRKGKVEDWSAGRKHKIVCVREVSR